MCSGPSQRGRMADAQVSRRWRVCSRSGRRDRLSGKSSPRNPRVAARVVAFDSPNLDPGRARTNLDRHRQLSKCFDGDSGRAVCWLRALLVRVRRKLAIQMNIHEYQAKQLFERFNVATTKGGSAETPEQAEQIAASLNAPDLVVKAQIHAGGRGKGTFKNGFKGGVRLCKTPAEARTIAEKMLGQTLVTHQTGPAGKLVRKVLVTESVKIEREIY